jgi:DNA-binding LacI/PurR family transcriptional regulator
MTVQVPNQRVTSADVARAAGVSRTTVSYVLNNTAHQKIPEDTRQRVLAAVASLAYAPSAAARALRTGRTDTVLCLLPDWPISPAVGELLQNLSAALAACGLLLVVHPRSRHAGPIADVWKAITPAAVIAFENLARDEVTAMRAAGIELIANLLGRPVRGRDFGVRLERTGVLQVQHLAAAGHRRLGFAMPEDARVQSFALPRLEGVRQACVELGLDEPIVWSVPLDPTAAVAPVRAWLAADPPVTGVCCYNDNVALAVLAGMRPLGLKAPADLAVIGVDDIPAALLADPPLTTVTTDMQPLASHIAATIASVLRAEPRPRRPAPDFVRLVKRCSA